MKDEGSRFLNSFFLLPPSSLRSPSMARMSLVLAVSAALGGLFQTPCGLAQMPEPTSAPPASVPGAAAEPDVLPGLPRPPDVPASLFQQPSPRPAYTCDLLPGPYFELDPRLDPPWLPAPGWFTDIELAILGPHVKNRLTDLVRLGIRMPDTIHVPSADLDWTVAPR